MPPSDDAPHDAARAIEDLTARFRAFQDGIPHLAWTATIHGEVDYCNRRWLDYTGLPMDQLLGHAWKQALHPDDVARHEERWKEAMTSGAPYEQDLRIRRHDGQFRWHTARDWPEQGAQHRILRSFGTMTDIHQQHEIMASLQHQEAQLRSVNSELELFAAIAGA